MDAASQDTVAAAEALGQARDGTFLLDVREQDEWDRGHSPLAVLVPMSQLQARLDEVPEDRRVLVVCHSGQRSAAVASALARAGYDAATVEGGMIAWSAAGGEIVASDGGPARVD